MNSLTLTTDVASSPTASSRKRCSDSVTSEGGKKRSVSYSTYIKWRREFDKECQTISWLDCDTIGKGKRTVKRLKCKVCLKYKSRIESRRNYSDKWLVGVESVRTSNIRDHACTYMLCHFSTRNLHRLLLILVNHQTVTFAQCCKHCQKTTRTG